MTKSFVAAIVLVAGLAAGPASAFDLHALKGLGFSPDGRHFGFMYYAPQFEAQRFHAEVFVIDAGADRFVPGAPLKITEEMKEDIPEGKFDAELAAFLGRVEKRSAKLVGQYQVSKPGVVLAKVADARAGEYETTPDKPAPEAGAASITARHPQLGDLKLALETHELGWPRTSKLHDGKEAPSCATEMDSAKGPGFRLTLDRAGRSIVLQDDKTIPASRRCVTGYGIVEVHAYDRPDGKVTLAVLLGMKTRGFEGEDRVFLAVTRVLDR
jgi:predicted secreted protein